MHPGATVTVECDSAGAWRRVASGRLASAGSYSVTVARPGRYRVLYAGVAGPPVTVGPRTR